MEPWNTDATIAETDCGIIISNQKATSEPNDRVLLLNFSNMKIGKVAQLSTAGNRKPGEPGDWMLAQTRLIFALHEDVSTDIVHTVSQTEDPFVIRVEVDPSRDSEAAVDIANYLEQFGLNSGIVHD